MNRSIVARFVLQFQDRASEGIGALQRRIQGLAEVARSVDLGRSVGAALMFVGPLQQAAAYDDALRQTVMTAGLSEAAVEESIARQGTAFEALARRTGQTSMDIAKSAGEMAAAGLSPELVQRFTPLIAEFATATGASMEDLGRVAVRLNQNLRITSFDEMRGAFASMLQASRDGSVEIADMARVFPTLTAALDGLNIRGRPAVDLLGSMLQIAARGATTSAEAGNNLRDFLSRLASPEVQENFRKMGVDIEQVMTDAGQRGINPIEAMIQKIRELTGGNMFRVGMLFGDMKVLDFLSPMLTNIPDYLTILRNAAAANESIIKASFEDRWRGLTIQMSLVQESAMQLSRSFAVNLAPAVRLLASGLVWLAERYTALSESHPTLTRNISMLALGIVGLVAAAGFLGFVLGPITAGFAMMGPVVSFLLAPLSGLTAGLIAIGVPAGLAAAAVAALATGLVFAAIHIYQHWERFSGFFSAMGGGLVDIGMGVAGYFAGLFTADSQRSVQGLQQIWQGFSGFFSGLWGTIRTVFSGFTSWIDGWSGGAITSTLNSILGLIDRLQAAWNALSGSFARGDAATADAAGPALGNVQARQATAAARRAGGFYPPGVLAGAVAGNDNPAGGRATVDGEIVVRAERGTEVVNTETSNSNVPITAAGNRGATRGRP